MHYLVHIYTKISFISYLKCRLCFLFAVSDNSNYNTIETGLPCLGLKLYVMAS